jgi:hypothetical protein
LKHIYETLEMRVGIRLADQMTNQQLDEFEQYFEAKDDAGAFKWLETNFPNYKDIVQEEFDKLKAEVAQAAPQILAASQQSGQVQAQPAAAQPAVDQGMPPQAAPAPAQPYAAPPQPAPQYQQPLPPTPPQPAPQQPQPYQPADMPQQQPPAGPGAQQ